MAPAHPMMRAPAVALAMALISAAPLLGQTNGAIAGHVRDAASGEPLAGARVMVAGGRQGAVTDTAGAYRIREVRAGSHTLRVTMLGYRPVTRTGLVVSAGGTVIADFVLEAGAIALPPVEVEEHQDPILDPLNTATAQRIDSAELRALPVTTVDEAVALSAGAVGESYRGGRVGQEALILDGFSVKNQLDASSALTGIRIPPDLVSEASLVTNGFSARYGHALSGMVNVVTKDGGPVWHSRAAWESDRPLGVGWDYGLDRMVVAADGPLPGGAGFAGAVDLEGRLDADPVNAPAPSDPRDPRGALLPHNGGERSDIAAKLKVPLGARGTLRLFGLRAVEQRLLFDQTYKYAADLAPARRISSTLGSVHLQVLPPPTATTPFAADLHLGYYGREFTRGTLRTRPPERLGAFTFERFRFVGEDVARARDTAAARAPLPGFNPPELSSTTPWGVPAFFRADGSDGAIAWNRYGDVRGQIDATLGVGPDLDLYFGGELSHQRVETFERVLGYLAVGDSVPPATTAHFLPVAASAYVESQLRIEDLALTLGVRYDRFAARTEGTGSSPQASINPRFAVSTVLAGATVVASWGRFSQAPDYQYLVDAAFDDTTRTGRFRRGNPDLGFEQAWQYELSVRARVSPAASVRINAYVKRLEGLVASVPLGLDPDSSIFGNADAGTVRGMEVILQREMRHGWAARISYTLQQAYATATDAYQLFRRIRIEPGGDTLVPARVEYPLDYDRRHGLVLILQGRVSPHAGPALAGQHLLGGVEAALVGRYDSGLPYSRTNATGDTLLGLPNSERLPSQLWVNVLFRRPLRIGPLQGSAYVDIRNVPNRRNVVAVRRDTGEPGLGDPGILARAREAYLAHPEAIPYESPRYRAWADADQNGVVEGEQELLPLFVAAARDYYQPLFAFGPPRLVRLGIELRF